MWVVSRTEERMGELNSIVHTNNKHFPIQNSCFSFPYSKWCVFVWNWIKHFPLWRTVQTMTGIVPKVRWWKQGKNCDQQSWHNHSRKLIWDFVEQIELVFNGRIHCHHQFSSHLHQQHFILISHLMCYFLSLLTLVQYETL